MGKLFNKSFLQRTVTGAVLVISIIACILSGPYSFLGLFCLLIFGVLCEFYNLVNISREVQIRKVWHSLGGVILFVCFFCSSSHITHGMFKVVIGNNVFAVYLIYLLGMFISRLYSKIENPIRELAYIILGQVYIALPLSLLSAIAFHSVNVPLNDIDKDYNPIPLLALFFFLWINDTGAFLTGVTLGKHKLFPRVSPKKSWEGFWGGVIFNAGFAILFSQPEFWSCFGLSLSEIRVYHWTEWMAMGIIVSVFGTFGDLVESFIKRGVGVKDSGRILPGHGGLWDRFDSLLLAAPALMLFQIVVAIIKNLS